MASLIGLLSGWQQSVAYPESPPARSDAVPVATSDQPMTLTLDATQAARGVVYAHMHIPVRPGPFSLVYPRWIPGEHGPTGPLNNMSMLRISAGGSDLAWQRDLVDLYAFHFSVPTGISSVDVDMNVLLNSPDDRVSTANIAIINWNRFLLYQADTNVQHVFVKSTVTLPDGWDYGTALPAGNRSGSRIDFNAVNLATLVDSPLDCGAHVKHVLLWKSGSASTQLDLFADKPQDLEISEQVTRAYKNIVPEALSLYGARHWEQYHFLLTLSDDIQVEGIEHHQSSDNRAENDFLTNDSRQLSGGDLLPHEFSHSWNGKYRRPADLTTANYQIPQKTDLLWVYEGLNQYLGDLLSFRAGIRKANLYPEYLASIFAEMDAEPGRQRDPLADTAVAAPYLYSVAGDYPSMRRRAGDFYTEGELIWLDADTIIREQSRGVRSLDDFLHLYAGAPNSPPTVKSYTREDVERQLNQVQPYDWHAFFQHYVYNVVAHPAGDELARSGWRLVYTSTPNKFDEADDSTSHRINEWHSLGLSLTDDGEVRDVRAGSAAWQAGFAAHMQILAVNGQQFSEEVLHYGMKSAQRDHKLIALLVKQNDWYRTLTLNYSGGRRYPHLVRDAKTPDMLAKIMSPHASRSAAGAATY